MATQPAAQVKLNFFTQWKLILDFQRDVLGTIKNFASMGDIVEISAGNFKQYMLYHPEMYHDALVKQASKFHKDRQYTDEEIGLASFLGNGLVTSDGEFWKRQRKLAQPAFHAKRIEAYAQTMVDYTLDMLREWEIGQKRNIANDMLHLTLKIVARTLFNTDISGDAKIITDAMDVLQDMSSQGLIPLWMMPFKKRRIQRTKEELDAAVFRMIKQWRAKGEDRGDLISMLLLAQDDDGNFMTDKQVRDESVTLLFAGHETTANAMNWTFYLLSQNPDVEAKLHEELDTVLQGQPPTLADLKRLPYTEMVIKESMRIFPPVYAVSRVAVEDAELAGYTIPKKSIISLFSMITHHDPRWWDEPERFKPERFAPDYPHQVPKYAYMPFGGGPRVCIGNSFAMMEACLLLATIASRYRLSMVEGHVVEPEPLITLRPKGGLPMRLTERQPVLEKVLV